MAIDDEVAVSGEKDSRRALPRVNPSPTWRVTEMILPVKRRMPFSVSMRDVTGSTLRERASEIVRPIDQAREIQRGGW